MKAKNSEYSIEDWERAYLSRVKPIVGNFYRLSSKSREMLGKLATIYAGEDPALFMEANFPPRTDWWLPAKNGGFSKLKYPYTSSLLSKKAHDTYYRLKPVLDRTELNTVGEKILKDSKFAIEFLIRNRIDPTNFNELWDSYTLGYVPAYVLVQMPNFHKWLCSALYTNEITQEEFFYMFELEKKFKDLVYEFNEVSKMVRGLMDKWKKV